MPTVRSMLGRKLGPRHQVAGIEYLAERGDRRVGVLPRDLPAQQHRHQGVAAAHGDGARDGLQVRLEGAVGHRKRQHRAHGIEGVVVVERRDRRGRGRRRQQVGPNPQPDDPGERPDHGDDGESRPAPPGAAAMGGG
jgi:hypothetical protein